MKLNVYDFNTISYYFLYNFFPTYFDHKTKFQVAHSLISMCLKNYSCSFVFHMYGNTIRNGTVRVG
jgi:hypothetical protein